MSKNTYALNDSNDKESKYILVQLDEEDTLQIFPDFKIQGQSLAQGLWLSGKLAAPALCSGLGRCASCKVRFFSVAPDVKDIEISVLGQEAVDLNWRLACRHNLEHLFATQSVIHLTLSTAKRLNSKKSNKVFENLEQSEDCSLALDLGTTSLCWQVVNSTGIIRHQGRLINPQMGAGADIISRLAIAMQDEGKQTLATLVYNCLQDIIESVHSSVKIKQICLAANTAMTAIFLKKNIQSLAHAPYSLPLQGHSVEQLQGFAPIYIPPQLSAFVGGDISAGYAALLKEHNPNFPFILADLGTNGEFILGLSPSKAFIASVPMGPALEGIGLSFGHVVDDSLGIVNAVRLDPSGLMPITINNDAPQSICATGYLSLIHALLKIGVLSHEGLFIAKDSKHIPITKKIINNLSVKDGENILSLWPNLGAKAMFISGSDVEQILKVKASFSFALAHLLQYAELNVSDLQHIYLAGAMGTHINIDDLEGLGFVPQGSKAKIIAIGNSSLDGARHLLLDEKLRNHIETWRKGCTLIPLTESTDFMKSFMQHMNFSYLS